MCRRRKYFILNIYPVQSKTKPVKGNEAGSNKSIIPSSIVFIKEQQKSDNRCPTKSWLGKIRRLPRHKGATRLSFLFSTREVIHKSVSKSTWCCRKPTLV